MTNQMTYNRKKILTLCLCAMFAALSAVGAFLRIPIPYLPITLQSFFTMMAGLLLGGKLGAASVGCYVLMGLLGVPVFTEGGGISYVLKPSFGYLVAFVIGAYVTGRIANKDRNPSIKRLLAANFIGLAVIYVIGMVYFFMAKNIWIEGGGMSVKALFSACFFPCIPGDIIKCIGAAFLAKRLIPVTRTFLAFGR